MAIPADLKERLASGGYAQKQFFCKSRIISWSHSSRFETARKLVEPYAGKRLLDYGCGDASFLALVHDLFPKAVGADLDAKQNAQCAERFADWSDLSFVHTPELADPSYNQSFDVITCMEVLEHCLPKDVDAVLTDIRRLIAPGGVIFLSVPIEIGPSLLAKETVRTIAGWRKLGDYKTKERYTLGELLTMAFAGEGTSITRPAYPHEFAPGQIFESHGHKGFNWKALRKRVRQDFDVVRTRFSPLGWTRGLLSSQVWLECRPRS